MPTRKSKSVRQPIVGEIVHYTDLGRFNPLAAVVIGPCIDEQEEMYPLFVFFYDLLRLQHVASIEFRTAKFSSNGDPMTWKFIEDDNEDDDIPYHPDLGNIIRGNFKH